MQIIAVNVYEGINPYAFRPVIKIKMDLGNLAWVPTNTLPGFNERLLAYLPTLHEHYCSRGRPGGFVERLREGTYLGHVIEHVILELQHLAGMEVIYGKTLGPRGTEVEIIFEYCSREGGLQAARSAVRVVENLLARKEVDIGAEIRLIQKAAEERDLGPSTRAIVEAARRRGIPVRRIGGGSLLQLGYGCRQRRVAATITDKTSCLGVDIVADKELLKELLQEAGIPVPAGAVAKSEEEALKVAERLGFPVVVKPLRGNHGRGVFLNLTTPAALKQAFVLAQQEEEEILVEKYHPGRHYRLTVVGERMVAAAERIPPLVVGDGKHTIKELVDNINQDPMRGEGHSRPLSRIVIDPAVILCLSRQGYTINSVPRAGEKVFLRENANLSSGGTAVDVTDLVHPENAELAVRAAKVAGLDVAGIDIVAEDISRPLPGQGVVVEVNACPGIRMHHFPSQGEPRDVAGAIIDTLFPPGDDGRIPVVAVTGTNGKTTTVRMLGHILDLAGYRVGMTTSDGIYVDGRKIMDGDTTGPRSAKALLANREVEVAVLETARGGILREGLGYDLSDVAIVTNVSADHLGQDGIETLEDMAEVKALVAEAVREGGAVVLNADDPLVAAMAGRVKAQVIYFSMKKDNPVVRRYLGVGGTAVFVRGSHVVVARGCQVKRIIAVKNIPATLRGIARHNLQNALAAAAGALALGVDLKTLQRGLATFTCSLEHNPGRLNIFEVGGVRIVVDYGHNAAGFESVLQAIRRLKPRRLMGVVGMPGDRLDESIVAAGRVCGRYFRELIIKEDCDLRGRKPGEVAALLKEGAVQGGLAARRIKIILPEEEAVRKALAAAYPGDTVVIFYERLGCVLKVVEEFKKEREAAETSRTGSTG